MLQGNWCKKSLNFQRFVLGPTQVKCQLIIYSIFFCLNLQHILGFAGIQNQKAWSYLGFTWEMYFFFFCFFLLLILELFLVRLMNSYLTFSSLLFQVCVCYVLNHIFTARTLKTLHKYGNTYLNSTEFIAVCMQK